MALSRITEAVASFTDLTIADDLTLSDDLLMASDAAKISFGADADVSFTHVADTGLLLNSTSVIQFNDASQNIGAPSATVLDINATDEIELNATLVDVNANLDVSGTIVSGGTLTATTSIGIGSAVLTEAELELLDGITAGTAAANKAVVLDGSKNIATIGTIGSGNITSSGTIQGTTITATTAFVPDASDGAALGTSSLEFSDLFLADGAVISFGDDQEITLTHVADDGLILKHVGTADGKEPSFSFHAGDNDIAANDVLGSIFFKAPDEGAGTDAILVAAGIEAVSEGDFSASNNATKLSFLTGASEAAAEKMSLSSGGNLTVSGNLGVGGTAVANTDTDTSNTGNVTLDFGANQNFVLTLTGNTTLANPSTEQVGQSGFIVCIQDGTGSRTLSLGTDYETAGGAGITLTSTASATDIIPYVVAAAGRILLGAPQLAFS